MPSAELADGQRDPMKWFYHDWLVAQLLDEPTATDAIACCVSWTATWTTALMDRGGEVGAFLRA